MNYSLSSSRKLGRYTQKIVTTWNNTQDTNYDDSQYGIIFNALKPWHTAWENADPMVTNLKKGTLEYSALIATPSDEVDNTGSKVDGVITFIVDIDGTPKTVTLTVNDNTLPTMATGRSIALLGRLIGDNAILSKPYYPVSIMLNFHR